MTRTVWSSDYRVRSFDKEVQSRVAQSAVVQVDNNRSYSEQTGMVTRGSLGIWRQESSKWKGESRLVKLKTRS